MEKSKCTIVAQNEGEDQKIEISFNLIEDNLEFDVQFDPPLDNVDADLGLAGLLVSSFINMIKGESDLEPSNQ